MKGVVTAVSIDKNELPDPYQPLKQLGRGGEGDAWLAWDPSLSRAVVLKAQHTRSADRTRRMAQFNHPNAPYLIAEIGRRTGHWWVLSYRAGVSLDRLKSDMDLGTPQLVSIGLDLMAALAAIHEEGMIHGDLGPANVVIDHSGCAQLIDFGCMQAIGNLHSAGGTPGFSPPDRSSSVAAAAVDYFGIGALLAWLCTGETPEVWSGAGQHSIVALPARPSAMGPTDEALWAIIETLVTPGPDVVSVAEILAALKGLANQLPGGTAGARDNMARVVNELEPASSAQPPPLPVSPSSSFGPSPWYRRTERRLLAGLLAMIPTVGLAGALWLVDSPTEQALGVGVPVLVTRLDATPTTPMPAGFSRLWLETELRRALANADFSGVETSLEIAVGLKCSQEICQIDLAHLRGVDNRQHRHQATLLATESADIWRGVIDDLVRAAEDH